MEDPMTDTPVRARLALLPRLFALLATSSFLVATSAPVETNYPEQICRHADQLVQFQVTGTCGASGVVTALSRKDECAIAVQGGGAVGLPSAGRITPVEDETRTLVPRSQWTLSGYMPESAVPAAATPDAGIFTVVRDAQAPGGPDGAQTPAQPSGPLQHGTPAVRTCAAQHGFPSSTVLDCSGGGLPDCQAILTRP
jgi:hypothetical protein